MSQEIKEKILAIASAKSEHERVTVAELKKHGFSREEIEAALKELVQEGKVQDCPSLFYGP